ncbi:hypothetical protein ISS37_08825 [candidate division KSB1 bacterium]|nr:hypothetical protein [candidate division KSB1 bacterium]
MLISGSLSSVKAQLNIGGYVKTDNRFRLQEDYRFTWNENRLNLKGELSPSGETHFYSEIWLRGLGFPTPLEGADLQRRDKSLVAPWSLELREAYLDLYGFLTDDLDVRIGRQRIAWGTADKLNPTDNLNPDDLEDIFDFGAKLGVNALKATYYLGGLTLTGVYIPIFTPATLPPPDWASALAPPTELPQGMILGKVTDTIALPEDKPVKSSMVGLKLETSLFNYDFSLSYFNGRDDLPLATAITINPVDTLGTVDVATELCYPSMKVIGLDMAGAVGKIGVWAEGALFIPEEVELATTIPTPLGMATQKSIALDDEPYLKFVMGGDYTFKNGFYINAQYLHGFIHERGKDQLEDYFAFGVEKKFLNDKLKVVPFGGAIEVADWGDLENNYAFIGAPEIDYYPSDAVELTVGAYLIDGKGSAFGKVKDNDEVFIKVKFSF